MPRQPGLTGRLPVKAPADRFPLKWAHEYLTTLLPTPRYPVDVTGGITDWGMLGNDQYGDCAEAGYRHVEMSTAVAAGAPVPVFTTAEAVAEYLWATGGADTGLNLADFLLKLYRRGRAKAFAPVDHTNRASVDYFTQFGYGLYLGVNLTGDAQQRFQQGLPWTVADGQTPDPSEGHCIVKTKADGADLDGYVTWGAEQAATVEWSTACVEEAWLVVTTEEQVSMFEPQLLADINSLGGTGG